MGSHDKSDNFLFTILDVPPMRIELMTTSCRLRGSYKTSATELRGLSIIYYFALIEMKPGPKL